MEQPASGFRPKKGIISLLFTLIVGSVALAIAVSMLILGTDMSLSTEIIRDSNQAKSLANACGEYALELVRDNPASSESNSMDFSDGNCNYAIITGAGDNRTINAQGNVGTVSRKIKILVNQIRPKILLTSWQEVADF